jgi:heme/copper-type cytochrome/quinol oxidase subunit 2
MEKYTAGFGLSLIVTSLLNATILLIKEMNASVMNAMKAALGHHWTTHGAIVITVFVVLGFVFSSMKFEEKWDSQKMLNYIIWATIIGGIIVAGFFMPNLKIASAIKY